MVRNLNWQIRSSSGSIRSKVLPVRDVYLVCVGHLHGGNGVTGIHRALECVLINHGQNIRQRRTVQNSSSTGHEVLSVVGRGSQDVSVLLGNLGDNSGDVFGQRVDKSVVLSHQHLSHTSHTGGVLGDSIEALAKDKYGDLVILWVDLKKVVSRL